MEDLHFKDIQLKIDEAFIEQGWAIVFSFGHNFKNVSQAGLYSALADADKVDSALQSHSWEIRYGHGRPGISIDYKDGKEHPFYRRIGTPGFEPLVYYRKEFGTRDSYLEFSEEFRLYYNLYEIYNSPKQKEYLFINDNGEEEVIAKIGTNEAFVKLNFLKEYLSVRKKYCLIYFDFMRFSSETLAALKLEETNQDYMTAKHCYNHLIKELNHAGHKVQSWLMGKCVIAPIIGYDLAVDSIMDKEGEYADFIMGFDDNGREKYFTCDDDKLANYFGLNEGAPQYVTPVYFKRDVLKKYYDNPGRYTVEDGYVQCDGFWSLRLDNGNKDYIIVLLGDLGKLHYAEQLYWKSYNIPPRKEGFSYTAYKRFFEGVPHPPSQPDLVLKYQLEQFNETWQAAMGWQLFKPLNENDSHYLKSLHLLTTPNNEKEFDEQVLALTKIFIDSLNEKALSECLTIEKPNVKGLDKLEAFLAGKDVEIPDMLKFFRNLQALRSTTVAHRRSEGRKETKNILEFFKLDSMKKDEVLWAIFTDIIKSLETLQSIISELSKTGTAGNRE